MFNRIKKTVRLGLVLSILTGLLPTMPIAFAIQYQFTNSSILLSTSKPSTAANWTITIENVQAIPADGTITITPEATKFTIPADMDFNDLDLNIASSEITLAATPGSGADSAWGVSITSGTSGSIVLTNNDTDTVTAESTIIIEIGTHATQGSTGEEQIVSPDKDAAVGTADIWSVDITSKDDSAVVLLSLIHI